MVYTGSTDCTVEVFESCARRTGQRHVLYRIVWPEYFAAARQHAQYLLTTHCVASLYADDVLIGGQQLRRLAAEASSELAGLALEYVLPMRLQSGGVCEQNHMRERRHRVWLARAVPRNGTSAAFCAAPCTRFSSRVDSRRDAWPCGGLRCLNAPYVVQRRMQVSFTEGER